MNRKAGETTGTDLDVNIRVSDLTLDGRSTGVAHDGRLGYGMEFYGVQRLRVHDVEIRNMPLSGIEVCGDRAANSYGVRAFPYGNSTPPLKCIDVIIERVFLRHIGWQERYLEPSHTSDLTLLRTWGDAGFGVIARAPARRVTFRDIVGEDVLYGVVGVGQLVNKNDSSKTGDNLAQVIDAVIEDCRAYQEGYGSLAPSIRAAFCRDVKIRNCTAVGNSLSQGIACRQAGSTPVQRVDIEGCTSSGNKFGVIVTGASESVFVESVRIIGGSYYGNILDGVFIEDFGVVVSAVEVSGNGRNGIYVTSNGGEQRSGAIISSCTAQGNGVNESGSAGIKLNNVTRCVVNGNDCYDEKTEKTQAYGIIEVGLSNINTIVGNSCSANSVENLLIGGALTICSANNTSHNARLFNVLASDGAFTAPKCFDPTVVVVDSSSPGEFSISTIYGAQTGQEITVRIKTNTRQATLLSAAGNIRLNQVCKLSTVNDLIVLVYDNGVWKEKSRSMNN
jgi:hypothetical protein